MPPHVQNLKEEGTVTSESVSATLTLSAPSNPVPPKTDTSQPRVHEKSIDDEDCCLLVQSALKTADCLVNNEISQKMQCEDSSRGEGIAIPLLLQPLLGLDFLPHKSPRNDAGRKLSDEISLETAREEPLYIEEEDHPKSLYLEEQAANEEILDPSQEEEKKKKRKSALGKLKSKVRKVKERRHQRRGRLGSQSSAVSTNSLFDDETPQREHLDSTCDSFFADDAIPPTGSAEDQFAFIKEHQSKLEQYMEVLSSVMTETQAVSAQADEIRSRVSSAQGEIRQLESVVARSIESLQRDMGTLKKAQNDLDRLGQQRIQAERDVQVTAAALRNGTQLVDDTNLDSPRFSTPRSRLDSLSSDQLEATPRAANRDSVPRPELRRTASSSFMRVHDLDLDLEVWFPDGSSTADSSISLDVTGQNPEDLFFLDKDTKSVLEALARFGYDMVTDESDRFKPVRDTERILSKRKVQSMPDPSCPSHPWYHATGKEILVWSGAAEHDGFGCSVPVLKARGIVRTAARNVVELILDSSRVKEYNKMSLGRSDVVCLQEGLDTKADEGTLGLPGEVKITKSLNKPPFIRRNIELLSLLYARPEGDGFLLVSRSVWEDCSPDHNATQDTLRSEMLLGVNYIRPLQGGEHCEMTTITHVYSPSVPEVLAKSFAPKAAANFIRDIQALF